MIDGKLTNKRIKELEEFAAASAEHSSTTERQAEEAERTVDDQKATEFMQTKIGEVFEITLHCPKYSSRVRGRKISANGICLFEFSSSVNKLFIV